MSVIGDILILISHQRGDDRMLACRDQNLTFIFENLRPMLKTCKKKDALDTNKEEYSQLDKLTKKNQEWIRQHKVLGTPYWHDTLHIRVGNYGISSTHFWKVQRERISSGALQNRWEGEAVRSRGGVVGGNLCFQSQIHSPTQTVRGIWSGLYTAWGWDSSYCWTQFRPGRDGDVGAPGSPHSRSSMKAYVRCFMRISPNTKEK